jgi:MFS family permease
MSLLMGFSFAIFYTFFGVLLGRVADTKSRRGLIAAGFVMWSALTAACGLARNYTQMLLLRMGVGVGEAALSPAAYSLITDYFPPQRLATAISVYSMGIYIGTGLAYLLGGAVISFASAQASWNLPIAGEIHSWQIIFFMVGMPGVLLAALMLTVREPLRRGGARKPVPMRDALAFWLANKRTFLCHNFGFALLSFSSYGASAWIPTFFVRRHGWSSSDIGIWYGSIIGVFGTLGIVCGGRCADWLASRGYPDATMRVGLIVSLAWFPAGICIYLIPNAWMALAVLALAQMFTSAPFGVAPAAIQQIAPPNLRGQASAIYLFVLNLIGLGLGPTAVAMTTDYVFGDDQMVGMSLLAVTSVAHVLSSALLYYGLKPFAASRLAMMKS